MVAVRALRPCLPHFVFFMRKLAFFYALCPPDFYGEMRVFFVRPNAIPLGRRFAKKNGRAGKPLRVRVFFAAPNFALAPAYWGNRIK